MLKYIFRSHNHWYRALPFFLFFWASAATAVTITDQGGSVLIENKDTGDSVTISSITQDANQLDCQCNNDDACNSSGNPTNYTLAAATRGKPSNRIIASLSCSYTAPVDGSTTISVVANGVTETKTISAGDGGDGGGETLACAPDQIGFKGELKSFEGGVGDGYLVFRLDNPDSDKKWELSENYITNVELRTTRSGDNLGGINVLFAGEQFNGWSGGPLVLPNAEMPQNSLALVTLQDGTNTRGVNVAFPSSWKAEDWMLCGDPQQKAKFDVWKGEKAASGVTKLDVTNLGGGVNVMGGEYACVQGWGFHHHSAVGVSHSQLTTMLSTWGVQTVRLPMNEHCWLSGLNGNPEYAYIKANNELSSRRSNFRAELLASPENCHSDNSHCDLNEPSEDPDTQPKPVEEQYSVCTGAGSDATCSTQGEGYRTSFTDLVEQLTSAGINVVLDLHWTDSNGDGSGKADGLTYLPGDHSIKFWEAVAPEFNIYADRVGTTGKVMYNLFNEPKGIPSGVEDWIEWRDGSGAYTGMQELVNAVRGDDPIFNPRAKNDIVVGGKDYGGDLRGWLTHAPFDPLNRLWADSHSYPTGDYKCWADSSKEQDGYACWDRTMLPIINEGFGAMFGEAGNSISRGGCGADVLKYLYNWVENRDKGVDIPVLQWAFLPGGASSDAGNSPSSNSCKIPSVITRWPGKTGSSGDAFPIDEGGEGTGFLAGGPTDGEAEKDTRDRFSTANLTDDGTWAGCLNWAYLDDDASASISNWTVLPDTDPMVESKNGNCSSIDWASCDADGCSPLSAE